MTAVRATARGLVVDLAGDLPERLHVDVARDDVVRLAMTRGGRHDERPTHALVGDPFAGPVEVEAEVVADLATPTDGVVARVRTAALVVRVRRDPFAVEVHRHDGTPVLRTDPGRTVATLNDDVLLRRRVDPGDRLYGLGERTGAGDRRGRAFTMWNTDVHNEAATAQFTAGRDPDDPRADRAGTHFDPYYLGVPLLHHLDAATGLVGASFVEHAGRQEWDLTGADVLSVLLRGGQWTEWVLGGPTFADVLEAYTWLTGRPALPPLWALGYHQSRWHPFTADELVEVGRRHRAEGVPLDALWLDIDHMDGFRVFTWHPDRFPDPAAVLARVREQGQRVVTIVDPGVKRDPGWEPFDDAARRDLLCRTASGEVYTGQVWPGRTAFPDLVRAEVRDWWADRTARHAALGVGGVWLDMDEPATGEVGAEAMRFDRGRLPHDAGHNEYALHLAHATADGLRRARPHERPFVLTRAGSAGVQRYAAAWLGDNVATWEHLALSLPMAAGLGLSGVPLVGADVGGFFGDTTPELLVRWTQAAALTPFLRNHSATGQVEQYAWSFGPAVLAHVRDAVRLRYRLLPYLYRCLVEAATTGAPALRPLVWASPEDPAARDDDTVFLLGPDLLVAPVLSPGATDRRVRVPAGEWSCWWTGTRYHGPTDAVLPAPLGRLPLLVRAGAAVPAWPSAPLSTDERPALTEVHVHVPSRDGRWASWWQDDDGRSEAVHAGALRRTDVVVERAADRVRVATTTTGAGYPGHADARRALVLHGAGGEVRRTGPTGGDVLVEVPERAR